MRGIAWKQSKELANGSHRWHKTTKLLVLRRFLPTIFTIMNMRDSWEEMQSAVESGEAID
jgi:hypothetical protein